MIKRSVPQNTLTLTLYKKAFEVMVTGEKKQEIRRLSKWILSRVNNKKKTIEYVKFINGYGAFRPFFICEYEGHRRTNGFIATYSNGLKVEIFNQDLIVIELGQIIEILNY